jgi:hypothetical protein
MDQKLLNALNNIGTALEELVDALNSKSENKTVTSSAIQSGDFSKDLKSISEGIKSIKADTQTIIKNQQTIMAQGKERESAKIKDLETDPKKESDIKRGVGTILLIAVAVLAIGTAFKLVGDINILSVIGLALGITIMSIAFEKVASLKMDIKEALIASGVIVILSIAVAMSSYFLNKVQTIGNSQFIAAILVSGIFVVLSYSLKNIIGSFKGVDTMTIISSAVFLPIILVSLSIAIVESSKNFSKVEMLSLGSFFGSILISAIFVVLSYSIRNMITAFSGINPATALVAALFLPTILVSIAKAIADSSGILSNVKMLSLGSFFGSILISAIFVVLSYAIKNILSGFKGITPENAITASIIIPILMVAISGAIWLSSNILDKVTIVSNDKLINAALIGSGLALITLAMIPVIKLASKLKPSDLLIAALAIPVIATTIMVSSWILSAGKYDGDFPTTDWIKGVSLSLLVFGGATIGLGFLITASGGLGLPALAIGAVGVLIVGTAIAATSHALKLGDYKTSYPGLDWAKGVSLSLVAFGSGMVLLGGIIFASFGIGLAMLKAGSNAVLMVAKTIVGASDILTNGYTDEDGKVMRPNYKGGPTKAWAEGISIALGAFSPVYGMLMKNKLLSFLGGGVGPEDFSKAIKTVSQGIVSAAIFFSENTAPFNEGNYPSKKWSEGVGGALGAFAPVFDMLMKKSGFWKSGDSVRKEMIRGIVGISIAIVSVAKTFSSNSNMFEFYPKKEWIDSIKGTISVFTEIEKYIRTEKLTYWRVNNALKSIASVARTLFKNSDVFSKSIDPNYISNVGKNIIDFNGIVKELTKSESDGILDIGKSLIGADPITQIAKRMLNLAEGYDRLAQSLTKLGIAMKTLNITDVRVLGGLTRQLVSPGSISSEKGTIGGQIENKTTNTSVRPTVGGSAGFIGEGMFVDKNTGRQLEQIIKLLTNIDKSSGSIDSLISQQIGDEDPKKESNIFGSFYRR